MGSAPLLGNVFVWLCSLNWASLSRALFSKMDPLPLVKLRPTLGEGLA